MTDLIIQGINGRMGHTLVEKISARSDCGIVAGVDQKAGQSSARHMVCLACFARPV